MEIVTIPTPKGRVLTYNEAHSFTRRNPTFLTKKQRERDCKIAKQIIQAYDVEFDKRKVMDIFFAKCHLLSDPRYWEMLRSVWTVCGSTDNANQFRKYFTANRRARSWFMTPEDSGYLDSLDYPVTLYRAYNPDTPTDEGISWTDDLEWCRKYAQELGRTIKRQQFMREEIYAYISRRGESEFIIL